MPEARSHTLNAVFDLLNRTGIPYCVLHGYEGFPGKTGSDVDLIVPASITAKQLSDILAKNKEMLGARVVRQSGAYFVLLCERELETPRFLILDFSIACEIRGAVFLDGGTILQGRQRKDNYWIPSPAVEFHCLLARRIAKGSLDEACTAHLTGLYKKDPLGCRLLIGTVWQSDTTEQFIRAADSGDWSDIRRKADSLANEIKRHQTGGKPFPFIRQWLATQKARVKRFFRPPGFHLVMLGPDGAGKSSVIDALEKSMVGPFARVHTLGFAPPIYKLWRKGPIKTDTPHALEPRSHAVSMLRALFWLAYNLSGYLTLRWAKSRSTLVLNDRHFIDILVDPVRYRYGGPKWMLHLIRKLIPGPDAIVLLHGPPEVLQARKRELTLAETERQCRDYLVLVQGQRNSHIVNAAQPFDLVMRDVCDIVFAQR